MKALLILSLCVVATLGFYRYIQGHTLESTPPGGGVYRFIQGHTLESTPLGGSTGLFSGVYWNSWGGQVYSGAYTGIHGGGGFYKYSHGHILELMRRGSTGITGIFRGVHWNS